MSATNYNPKISTLLTRQKRLTTALFKVIEDYSLIQFFPLDRTDEDCLLDVTRQIDASLQYGEDLEVKPRDYEDD